LRTVPETGCLTRDDNDYFRNKRFFKFNVKCNLHSLLLRKLHLPSSIMRNLFLKSLCSDTPPYSVKV
jgi:hypothetical protein